MANSMIVVPLTADPELRSSVAGQGLPIDDAAVGVAPSVDLLVRILAELNWPCAPSESDGWWYANVDGRDGRYPPISDMALHDGSLSFRIGPLFGPWDVVRYRDVVELLRQHLTDTAVPIPELVWAFGQADGVGPDLADLVNRLRDDPSAVASLDMAELFLRHHLG